MSWTISHEEFSSPACLLRRIADSFPLIAYYLRHYTHAPAQLVIIRFRALCAWSSFLSPITRRVR